MKPLSVSLITTATAVTATLLLGGASASSLAAEPAQNNYLLANRPVVDNEIRIGMSLPLTGPSAQVGSDLKAGVEASFKMVNDAGGIAGRKLKLVAYDDHYEPLRTVNNLEKLINQDRVFALCSTYGTPTTTATLAMLRDAKLPLVGCFTGAESLRTNIHPYVFHLRSGYLQESTGLVEHLVEDYGAKKIAVVVQNDGFGDAVTKSVQTALTARGLKLVATVKFVRNSLDVEQAVEELIAAQPEAVIIGGVAAPAAEIVRLARERKFQPYFCSVSFVGAESFLQQAGPAAEGVVISQVVPSPYDAATADATAYQKALKASLNGEPSYAGYEGYLNAQIIVNALRKCGKDLTTDSFLQAMQGTEFNLAGQFFTYGPAYRQGFKQVFFTCVRNGKIETVETFPPHQR